MTTETFTENPAKFGNRLKIAREAQHLTEKDIGLRLHLNPEIITALEQENFQDSTPNVFIRGYLRSYARLLNFTEADIEHALKQWTNNVANVTAPLTPPKLQKAPKTKVERLHSNHPYMRWATHFIMFLLISLVGIWWHSHSHNNNDKSTMAAPTEPLAPISTDNTTQAPVATPTLVPNAAISPAPPAPQATTNPAPPATTTANPPVNTAPAVTPPTPQQKTNMDEMAVPEPGLVD